MLTLLTMTGARPDAWTLCKRWMAAQDYGPNVHWIIVDDGERQQDMLDICPDWRITLVRPTPHWQPGQNTQCRNVLAGLEHVRRDDRLMIIEDDDYYAPDYLSHMNTLIDDAEMVGESHALYFNLQTGAVRRHSNDKHASLCQTGLRGRAIDELRTWAETGLKFIDIRLWNEFVGSKRLVNTDHCIGIKGMPGRGGIGMGHSMLQGNRPVEEVRNIMTATDFAAYGPYMGGWNV